jgi:uncharacterized membrane protein YraQ (UPF0718 family)
VAAGGRIVIAARPAIVPEGAPLRRYLTPGAVLLLAWWLLYRQLPLVAKWMTYSVLNLAPGTHLATAVEFFLYDLPKVLLLLVLVVFVVGIIRTFFTPERTRAILIGKREVIGNVFAAGLGTVTPFCSCSAVPLFIGFVTAGIPLGVTFSFLIAAPMVNEVAVVLLVGLFGWKVAGLYLVTGLAVAISAGCTIGRLGLTRLVEPWVYETRFTDTAQGTTNLDWSSRIGFGVDAVRQIVGRVWPYVAGGIAVGAAIHGYVPAGFLAGIMGKGAWWSVPLAVLVGIPMYSNAAGMIPVVQALLGKGAALGTVLAFMMSVIALSLPEFVILRKVLKPGLIVIFATVVGLGILVVGYLFNAIL